jgi:adenosylcobinamide-GDP ribazoletransferase
MNNFSTTLQRIKEDILAAFMLLTRFPVNWEKVSPNTEPNINRSLWAYPIVGLVISIVGAVVYWVSTMLLLPQFSCVILSLTAMILSTGAFHEDGLADVVDGFGGGLTVDKKLEIMRDSQIGTYGGLALIISILLKVSLLSSFNTEQVIIALIVGAMLSRVMIIIALRILPAARKNSLSVTAGKPSWNSLSVALMIAFLFAFLFLTLKVTIITFIVATLTTGGLCRIAYKQVGGVSGDILGAVQQISEIAIFITLAMLWGSQ